MNQPDNAADTRENAPSEGPAAIAGRIASILGEKSYGTGPLADLRRLDPSGALASPALHRLLARHLPPERVKWREDLRDWALIVHCLALAAPGQLGGESRLGRALQQAGLKEQRFTRLLQASPEELRDLFPRAVRFLVQKGGRLSAPSTAWLVLSARSDTWGPSVRQEMAGDYYRSEYEARAASAAD